MTKALSTELTATNIATVLDLLTDTPHWLESLSQSFPETRLHQPLGVGKRSFTEDLAHLMNCEARTSEAIYLALLANEPLLINIHPKRQFGKLLRYAQLPITDLVAYFRFRRVVLLRVLKSLKDRDWSRVVREEGKRHKESVYLLCRMMALHEPEHLSDLECNTDSDNTLNKLQQLCTVPVPLAYG